MIFQLVFYSFEIPSQRNWDRSFSPQFLLCSNQHIFHFAVLYNSDWFWLYIQRGVFFSVKGSRKSFSIFSPSFLPMHTGELLSGDGLPARRSQHTPKGLFLKVFFQSMLWVVACTCFHSRCAEGLSLLLFGAGGYSGSLLWILCSFYLWYIMIWA